MTEPGPLLDADALKSLLIELADELEADGSSGQLFLVGGAAMALAHDTRRATRDLDGVFEPKLAIYAAAERVADRHPGLAPDWLNDAVKAFLPGTDPNATTIIDHPALQVQVASPDYLLAMKVLAARLDRDDDDIRSLAGLCSLSTADEVLDLVVRFYPDANIPTRVAYVIEDILGSTTDRNEPGDAQASS
ncbi:DUF6036 family nucleotidyltransferase [Candidatus Neomicrothrix sp.]|jgi:hypothetical protein|uniref:DUF6036 family nucleotidyltransferase n=1 Tax=Candidatus Neomicrothrix sp. TaxID=2719034 RepID=UPI0016B29F5F|nr:DUF6036 family nucleotidyltransferase [Candidatus Microthrix sp.]MBP7877480.1 hypothetical protein [Candidatus Microthrix sp.]NLH66009.1 hypothetical protein [Candidatus Microthrix parvicella]